MINDVTSRIAGITSRVGVASTSAAVESRGFGELLDAAAAAPASAPDAPRIGAWSGAIIPGTIGAMLSLRTPPSVALSVGQSPTSGSPPSLPVGALSGDAAERRGALAPAFAEAGARYGIDPALLEAVAWSESNFDPTAVSPAGAIGLMQIMPGTAADLGVDPSDPIQAIDGAARYLRQQLDRFGRIDLALAAYNAGPGAVQQHGGIPPYPETTAYVAIVSGRYESLRGASA